MGDMPRDINNYLNQYIQLMDMKATAIAAAALVIVGLGLSDQARNAEPLLRLVGSSFAGVAAVFAGLVVIPRTPHSGNGHIFWADIDRFDGPESYWKSLRTLDADEIGREYSRQNYFVSKVLLRKARMVRRAIWWFGFSCLSFAVAVAAGSN